MDNKFPLKIPHSNSKAQTPQASAVATLVPVKVEKLLLRPGPYISTPGAVSSGLTRFSLVNPLLALKLNAPVL